MTNDIFEENFWDYCKTLEFSNAKEIALKLQKKDNPYNRFLILNQILGLQISKIKLPSWYDHKIIYPPKLSLEQCSSEWTAKYKKSIVNKGTSMIDLTAGFGVDCAYLSDKFDKTYYNECNTELAKLVEYNYNVLGFENITTSNKDAIEILDKIDSIHLVYIDPARRDNLGRKTVSIEDCEPNIVQMQDSLLEKADQVLIKLSPMLDIDNAILLLKNITSIHIVSVKNECKELLFLLDKTCKATPEIVCVNIQDKKKDIIFNFTKREEIETEVLINTELKKYILEPNSSLLKAGAFKCIAKRFDLEKLHPNTHLYTTDNFIEDFPGRIFEVDEVFLFHSQNIKNIKKEIKKGNLSTRNFPLSTENLKKKLNITDGGDIYIFGTTIYNEDKVILTCRKSNPPNLSNT